MKIPVTNSRREIKKSASAAMPGRATQNYILNKLPEADFARLLPNLEKIDLSCGQVLWEAKDAIDYPYFPDNSMISMIAESEKGEFSEVGVIGREGMVGIDALFGGNMTANRHIIQIPGSAHRIKPAAAIKEFRRFGAFHDLMLDYVRLMIAQISQTALCNRRHSVEERLAKWLLLYQDCAESNKIKLTQEFLSHTLGTKRVTVTMKAIVLQDAELIKYSRGRITILDRKGLEALSCECYRNIKKEYNRFQQ